MNTKTINKLRRVLKTEENETSILVLEKLWFKKMDNK